MFKKSTPAPADVKPVSDEKPVITNAKLSRTIRDGVGYPCLTFKGDVPAKGRILRAKIGVTIYSGKVTDSVESDGDVHVEFQGGLTAE